MRSRRFGGVGIRLAVALVAGWMGLIAASNLAAETDAAQGKIPTAVRLVIDYGDGCERQYTAVPWKADMTVLDAMNWVKQHPHGVRFKSTGSGANLLVNELDGIANEGGGVDAKNWIFSVNDKKGNKSCAVTDLKPADTVVWKFCIFSE